MKWWPSPSRLLLSAVLAILVLPVPAAPADEDPAPARRILLRESREAYAAGHYDSALVGLDQLRETAPGNPDVAYFTALSCLALGDTSRAESVLAEGIARSTLSSRLRLLSARLDLILGDLDAADESISRVLLFKRNHPEALYLRGLVGLARADTVLTLDSWQRALDKVISGGGRP